MLLMTNFQGAIRILKSYEKYACTLLQATYVVHGVRACVAAW